MDNTKYVSKEDFLNKAPTNKPNYYAIITANVRYSTKISDSAKLLFGEITALSNKHGYAFPSNQYLAELYDTSERTIQRRLKELKDNGFINVILIRDKDSKEVLQRQIYPKTSEDSTMGGHDKSVTRGPDKSVGRSPDKSVGYNTTRVNVINNNNKNVVVSQKTIDLIKNKTKNKVAKKDIQLILEKTNTSEEQLLKIIELMTQTATEIKNPIGWILVALQNKYESSESLKFDKKNAFHDFQSGKNYTEEELLQQLGIPS
jgi:hypothetical protein